MPTRYSPPSIAFDPKSYPKPKKGPPKRPAPRPIRPGQGFGSSAEAEADRIIAELLSELGLARGSARQEAERSAQQEIARAQALAQALQALGIPANIQNIYQSAAQGVSGLAQGFSGEFRDLAAAQGAEQANMVAGTGQEGAVRNEGVGMGDVLYGAQGFIPARGLEQTGAAFASEAALQPGFALQFGQIAASKQIQDFIDKVLPEFTEKEALIRTKRPSLVAEIKDKRKAEAMDLYQAGLLTQRQLARRMGVSNWRKFPNSLPGEKPAKASASLSKAVGYLVDEFGQPILNSKGKPIALPRNLERFGSASAGYWMQDPVTGDIFNVLPPQPKQYAPKGYQLKTLKDGSTAVFDPNTGQTSVIAPPPKGSRSKLTAQQRAKFRGQAATFAQNALFGFSEPGRYQNDPPIAHPPLTLPEALEELKKTGIPWGLGKAIVVSFYRKNFIGPLAPKGKPPSGGRQNTAMQGPESLEQPLWAPYNYALSQGFTDLGTYNPDSRLPGGGISDHAVYPARAFDLGFKGARGWGNAKARKMFWYMTRQPGVKYVILGDKIWSPSRGLHAYTSGGHDSHIHVSGSFGGGV